MISIHPTPYIIPGELYMIRNVLIQSKGHIVIILTSAERKRHFSAHNLRLGMPWLACACAKFQALHCKQIGDKLSRSRDLADRQHFHRCLWNYADENKISFAFYLFFSLRIALFLVLGSFVY